MLYLQRKGDGYLETVDEFVVLTKAQRAEAIRVLAEYRLADPAAHYYLSSRACKAWRDAA